MLGGLAGCGALPFGGGGSGNAFYRDWLVAPDSIEMGDHYSFSGLRPSAMDGNEEFSDTDTFDIFEAGIEGDSGFGPTDVNFEDIDTVTSIASGIYVATGSFTVEDVASELDDNDYDEEDQLDSGERVFLNTDTGSAFGVSSNTIVAAHSVQSGGASGPEPPEEPGPSASVQDDVRSISYGETVTGEIDNADPTGRRGNYEPITFQGSAGDVVTIDMVSDDDTYLLLDDPDGNEVTSNDDYTSLDSRINAYTLQQSGEYTIIATSYSSYDTFSYRLSLNLVRSPDDLVDTVEAVVGVGTGDTESYESANENVGPLVDALGGGALVFGSTFEQVDGDEPESGTLEDSVAAGLAFGFGDGQFNVTGAVVYDSEGDVDADDVEDWADEGTALANGEIDDVSTSTNGRVATFSGVTDYDELLSSGGGGVSL